ncbi:putative DNA repair protein [Aspergillus undulatus]|uniref:putative DNA repair protein n=1 Tax=Aspergillus undulatus TaxID=1810928 RepID=UPI003CCCB9ED
MSTFDGIVQEFPFITIDYFRKNPDRPPPLACFLSHAHSDHFQGLESFRSPFIYCSAATRELLLRIEKYPHRMNFNNGILESRRLHYKNLAKLLKPIPLNTPTEIDLTPRLSIRVTLLDANHCTGAVMFLIEGDGKAILYTGDIRAESWWVDGLIRHPVLIPYTMGTKLLDKIYLDTTFARSSHTFRTFPSKAEGIAELLRKLEPYPENTTFYFRAWTFGYEEVWVALAAALKSKIHVDRYQIGLYRSVLSSAREGSGASETPSLCGFDLGNRIVPGCLSEDEQSRIHSCEPGVHCSAASSKNTVYITPIVSRTDRGSEVPEIGAGGGLGDLYQVHELELPDQSSLSRLEQLCSEKIQDPEALSKAKEAILKAFKSRSKVLSLDSYGIKDTHEMPLDELVNILSRGRLGEDSALSETTKPSTEILNGWGKPLPRTIRFPYSRHSSYAELCELVAAFKPRDIHPCIVDSENWDEGFSMQRLFGHLCSDNKFIHDQYMRDITGITNGEPPRKRTRRGPDSSTQSTQQSTAPTDDDSQSSIRLAAEKHRRSVLESRSRPIASEPRSSRPSILSSSPLPPSATAATTVQQPLDTFEDATDAANPDSLEIPPLSPRAAKARRNTIRQAWHLLQDAQKSEPNKFHLGSLPDSWPTNESSQLSLSASQSHAQGLGEIIEQSSQVTAIHEPNPGARGVDSEDQKEDIVIEVDSDVDPNPDIETNAPHRQNPHHHSSQQSYTNTVSTSAFASQSRRQSQISKYDEHEHEHRALDEEDYLSEHEHEDPMQMQPPPSLLRRKSSIRNRRAAYAAAREDSFDAWAAMALTSAGNNHTEEEVEL